MEDGAEFYMAPIEAGYYSYPDLLNGTVHIEHIAECVDAMACSAENRRRIQEAVRAQRNG